MAGRTPRGDSGRAGEPRRASGEDDAARESSFGSFVSDSVRRSAGSFRGEPPDPDQSPASQPASELTAASARDRSRRARRPGERQRRQVFVPPAADPPAAAPREPQDRPDWLQMAIDRVGGTDRALVALALTVVALLALIWVLSSVIGGGDGGRTPTPTEALQVFPVGGPSTPEEMELEEDTPAVIATEEAPPTLPPLDLTGRGSDNVLDQMQQEGTPESGLVSPIRSSH